MTNMPPRSASAIAAERAAPPRTRLLLLTDTTIERAGGSERFLRNLVALLPRARYDITLVQLGGAAGDASTGLFEVGDVRIHRMPVAAVYGRAGLRAMLAIRRLARAERFDIVQSQHEKSDLLAALLPRRFAAIRISNRRDMGFNKSARLRKAFRALNHRFDAIAAPSRAILDALVAEDGVDAGRIACIPNGVDTRRFTPLARADRDAARRALGLDADATVFVCVARLTPVKRHVDLLEAFARVRAALPTATLLLVGDGPLRADVEAQGAALGLGAAMHVLGDVADVETLLPAADIGVLCSSTEGMSNALLEMMACGLPVIATEVGGNPALVTDGEVGRLVAPCAPDALAAAMLEMATTPGLRERMGHAARAQALDAHSVAAMARSFDALYAQLLDAHAVPA